VGGTGVGVGGGKGTGVGTGGTGVGTGTGGTATATGTGGSATATGGSSVVNVNDGGSGVGGGGFGSGGGGFADAIGQIASAISAVSPVEAAPVQQVVAAAPVVQPVVAAPVASTPLIVAHTAGFRAIALGWNDSGAWIVRTSPTLVSASVDAMQACNNQFGSCTLSDAQVEPTAFGCLVVAQSDDAGNRLFAAAGDSIDTARAAVSTQITNAGLHGQIVYNACNA
jgi:hypothetical protein